MAAKNQKKDAFPRGLLAWEAYNSPGQPVCVAGNEDASLTVALFTTPEYGIVGVAIYGDEGQFINAEGLIPASAVKEILA